jgi:hypothetical protein
VEGAQPFVQQDLRRAGERFPRKVRELESTKHERWIEKQARGRTTLVDDELQGSMKAVPRWFTGGRA